MTERDPRVELAPEQLARFPEENPDPVMRIGADGALLYANPAARERLRRLGVAAGRRAPPELADLAARARAAGSRVKAEVECEGVVFQLSAAAVGGEVNVYGQDVTDRKRALQALQQSEDRLKALTRSLERANEQLREVSRRKDEFLAMLSHELRNPLAPIGNAVRILEMADPAGQQAARAKAVIERQVGHLTRIVDDLLDVTRIVRGKVELHPERIDVIALARRAAEDHRALMYQRAVSLGVALPDAPAFVEGDATRVTQALGNLLQNAAKFTPRGGRVEVSARVGEAAVEIEVADTGVGVDAAMLDRIFEPFVQGDASLDRAEGGLGLGLAIVKGMIELHGGTARVASDGRGKGARFSISLPLSARAPPRAAAPRELRRSAPGLRVLVVDDNRDAAESLADFVSLLGHATELAYDGPAAIEAAGASRPDVVLCDIGLPGMNGYEVARALRARGDRTCLVAVSGYAQPEDVQRALESGFDAHLAKPADPARLEELLCGVVPAPR